MKNFKLFQLMGLLAVLAIAFTFTSCKEDDPQPTEALITEFAITNAGSQGNQRIEGVISGMNILVAVPYETNLTALTTDIKLSDGAMVVPASGTAVDFSSVRSFVVTNGAVSNTYQVTVQRAEPTSGVITSLKVLSASSGEEYGNVINQTNKTITVTFNDLQSSRVVLKDLQLAPAGTTHTTSSGNDTLDLSASASITLSYAGAQTVYNFVANITAAGFNPDNTTLLMDKSLKSALVPSVINNENNRGAAFDGKHVFVVSRKDGNHVYYWDVDAPTAEPKTLAFSNIITGGTWMVSDIRVVGGNIYVSNMVNADGGVFKVYKWEGVDDETPELVFEYTVSGEGKRLGDAISVIGNPPADGYIFASNFAWPNNASEFYVWNFNNNGTVTPTVLPITPLVGLRMGQYGRVNPIAGSPDLLLVTGAEMGIAVMDYSGDIKYETSEPTIQSRSFDPRIFEYNGGRYISFTVNREWEAQGAWYEVINITEGATVVDALKALNSSNIAAKRVYKHVFGGAGLLWVSGTNGMGFGSNGKPRVMGFAISHGFVVHQFSN
jgi:hypothetical protein